MYALSLDYCGLHFNFHNLCILPYTITYIPPPAHARGAHLPLKHALCAHFNAICAHLGKYNQVISYHLSMENEYFWGGGERWDMVGSQASITHILHAALIACYLYPIPMTHDAHSAPITLAYYMHTWCLWICAYFVDNYCAVRYKYSETHSKAAHRQCHLIWYQDIGYPEKIHYKRNALKTMTYVLDQSICGTLYATRVRAHPFHLWMGVAFSDVS